MVNGVSIIFICRFQSKKVLAQTITMLQFCKAVLCFNNDNVLMENPEAIWIGLTIYYRETGQGLKVLTINTFYLAGVWDNNLV
ncbi:hypothetical protein NC652_037896 [Populus alba x Populus x berolinensis]|nr:hypothetical protein NC652_037896 [Populus alba x Populus x berolinensis]